VTIELGPLPERAAEAFLSPEQQRPYHGGCVDADPLPARAILDDQLGQWISDAEIPFTALAQTQSSPGSTTRTHRRDVSVSCPANGVLLVKAWESVKPWVGAGVSDVDDEDGMPAAVREEFGVDAGGVEP